MNLNSIFIKSTNSIFIQFFRYFFVGGFAFIVDFGLLYILTEFVHFHYLLSASLSFFAGLILNYFLSTIWVFNKSKIKSKSAEFFIFAAIGLIGLGLNALFMWIFTDLLVLYYLISKIITTMLVYFWNFFARKFILFI